MKFKLEIIELNFYCYNNYYFNFDTLNFDKFLK